MALDPAHDPAAGRSAPAPAIDVESFRAEVQAFLSERYELLDPLADDRREDIITRAPDGEQPLVDAAVTLQRDLAAAGLAAAHVPVELGGRGLTAAHHKALEAELRRFDAPSLRPLRIGLHLVLATLLRSASEEQKARYVPPLIRAEEQWCQLFSEPDAGSDLASLRTRARWVGASDSASDGGSEGGSWILDGQKVWSSYAGRADFGLLLARSDPDSAKPQTGMTMFVLPMDAPGVTVRPLVDVTGGAHFNEVFLSEVHLGPEAVVGEVNAGWSVSQGTLGGERSGYMGGCGGGRRAWQVIGAARDARRLDDPIARQRIAAVLTAERVLELVRDRYANETLCDGHPAAGSMMKLIAGTLEQDAAELVADLTGPAALAWSPDDRDGDIPAHDVAATRQSRIAGGTHEIQRTLLAERVLGLPRA